VIFLALAFRLHCPPQFAVEILDVLVSWKHGYLREKVGSAGKAANCTIPAIYS